MRRNIFISFCAVLVMMAMVPRCEAQGTLFGQGVTMDPNVQWFNASVTLTVRFRVEGAPVRMYPHDFAVRKFGQSLPPPPTVAGATPMTYDVGEHEARIDWITPSQRDFTLHAPGVPPTFTFEIVCGRDRQVLIRDLVLRLPLPMRLDSPGYGMRVHPMPAVAGDTAERREPPLEIAQPRFRDGGKTIEFLVHKPGGGYAANVRWEIEAHMARGWQIVSNGVVARIDAGSDARVRQGGFPSIDADRARISVISPLPRASVELIKPHADLYPSNCHVRKFARMDKVDVGLGISNLGEGDAGSFLWEVRRQVSGHWVPIHSERIENLDAGKRFVKGNIHILAQGIRKGDPLQVWTDTEHRIVEGNEGNNVCDLTWLDDSR